jgi:hypothetical protein
MTPREPSNADLLREIRGIRDIVNRHDKDIQDLKEWHIAVEAAKQALKEAGYGKEEKEPTSNKAMAAVVGVIALLTAVILALVKVLP